MFKKKVAKTDFNKSLLPHNRKEQFSFIFKNRKRELFYIGLLLFIFIIPIIVGFGFYNVLINILYNDYKSASVGLTGDDLIKAYETYRTSYVMYTDIFSLAMIGGLIVFGIGVSGVIYLIRNLYWGELFFFKESFFKGIKQNALMVCLIFAIYGVINWLCIHIFVLDINEWLKVIPVIAQYVFILPLAVLMIYLCTIYKENYFTLLRMALIIFLKHLPTMSLFSLMVLYLYSLLILPNVINYFSIAIIYPIFMVLIVLIAPLGLGAYFVTLSRFLDNMINQKNYPELVDKGLYKDK